MTPYCSPCLDVWSTEQKRIDRGDFINVTPGVSLHVSCGRALEAIRTAPPVFVASDGDFPPLPVGWAC